MIGALSAVILNTGAGSDTLDFSGVASDLTVTVAADGTRSVTDGVSTVTGIAGAENIVTGTGLTTFVFEDGASLGAITGSGQVKLDYSAYTTSVTVNLGNGSATGTGGVGNIRRVIGGAGSDTLIGPDAAIAWSITGAGSGSVAGVPFSNIQNLSGGSGSDAFVFAGGSASSVSGGGGSDTLDLSADAAGVTVDLSAGTATYAGAISGIENVVTGAGSDTLIGALSAVILDTGAGADTLDFSNVSSADGDGRTSQASCSASSNPARWPHGSRRPTAASTACRSSTNTSGSADAAGIRSDVGAPTARAPRGRGIVGIGL